MHYKKDQTFFKKSSYLFSTEINKKNPTASILEKLQTDSWDPLYMTRAL